MPARWPLIMPVDSARKTVPPPTITETQPAIADGWEAARQLGWPAALWRLPNQSDKHLIVAFDAVLPRVTVDLDELPAGFAISPFDNLDTGPDAPGRTLFLRADVHIATSGPNEPTLTIQEGPEADRFRYVMAGIQQPPNRWTGSVTSPSTANGEQLTYEQNVAAALDAIRQGTFRKVVLSRTKHVTFSDVPNCIDLFDTLCRAYPAAFISVVSLPEKGQIWVSATPERLVSQDADGFFRTASLAGTQSAFDADGRVKKTADALWSQKEIEEQAIVSRYIIECFKKIRLREYLEEGPKTIVAGNLMHLGSQFTVDTQAVHYPQLGTVMLRLLHPTSAVCGMPRDAAFDFIRAHEPHDREFYSGFLGPVNMNTTRNDGGSHLFVHIRCMKLEGATATLYAGAGITEDSVPAREWFETEMKCQTLLACLGL